MNKFAAAGAFNRNGMQIIKQLSVLSQDVEDITLQELDQDILDKIAANAEKLDTLVDIYKANLLEILKEAAGNEDISVTGIDDGNGIRL